MNTPCFVKLTYVDQWKETLSYLKTAHNKQLNRSFEFKNRKRSLKTIFKQ